MHASPGNRAGLPQRPCALWPTPPTRCGSSCAPNHARKQPAGYHLQHRPRPCVPSGNGPTDPPVAGGGGGGGGGGGSSNLLPAVLAVTRRWLFDHVTDCVLIIGLAMLYGEVKELKADMKGRFDEAETETDRRQTKVDAAITAVDDRLCR